MWCVRDCDGHVDPGCGFTDIQGRAVYRWHALRRAQPSRRWRVVECPDPPVVVPRACASPLHAAPVAPASPLHAAPVAPASPLPAEPLGGDAQLARRDAFLKYRAVFEMWYR